MRKFGGVRKSVAPGSHSGCRWRCGGYQGWWLVDDLVAGISLYLRNCYVKNVIDLPELEHVRARSLAEHRVRRSRRLFPRVSSHAGNFAGGMLEGRCQPPTVRPFSRSSPKRSSGCTSGRLDTYTSTTCMHALINCSTGEDGTHPSRSEYLREKIVSFVRDCVHSQDWTHPVRCSIT